MHDLSLRRPTKSSNNIDRPTSLCEINDRGQLGFGNRPNRRAQAIRIPLARVSRRGQVSPVATRPACTLVGEPHVARHVRWLHTVPPRVRYPVHQVHLSHQLDVPVPVAPSRTLEWPALMLTTHVYPSPEIGERVGPVFAAWNHGRVEVPIPSRVARGAGESRACLGRLLTSTIHG